MTDVPADTAKPKKQQVAIRDWIDSAGNPVDSGKEFDAVGPRYIHLPTAKRLNPQFNAETDKAPDGSYIEVDMTKMPAHVVVAYATFGAQTLWGNVVNTATNGPKGDPNADVITLIAARHQDVIDKKWSDREAGVGGVRYDKDALAAAICAAKGESNPAPYLAKMDGKVDPKSGAPVAADTKGAISYGALAMRNPAVKGEYDKIKGTGVALGIL